MVFATIELGSYKVDGGSPDKMPSNCMPNADRNDSHAYGDEGIVHGHIHNYDNMTLIHGHVHRASSGAGNAPADRSFMSKTGPGFERMQPSTSMAISNKCFDESDDVDCQFFQFVNYHQSGKTVSGEGAGTIKSEVGGKGLDLLGKRSSATHLYNDEALVLPANKRKLSNSASDEKCHCPPKILEICCDMEHDSASKNNAETADIIPRAIDREELRRYKKNRKQVLKSGIDSFANLNINNLPGDNCDVSCGQDVESHENEYDDEDDENIFEKFCEECLNLGHVQKREGTSPPESLESGLKNQHFHYQHHDHSHPLLPRENSSTTLSSTQSADSELESSGDKDKFLPAQIMNPISSVPPLATKKYPHHVMSSHIDLQILDDLCNISSLYEVPFANHMNHHNHVHDNEGNQGINLLESSIKGDPQYPSGRNNSGKQNHHHHRVQLQKCTMTNCQPTGLNNDIAPTNYSDPAWSGRNYSFERSTVPKIESPMTTDLSYHYPVSKSEEVSDLSHESNMIEFNWSFKKEENAIQCKWDQCPESFSSLIDLQKHMLSDHVADKDASCYWIPCTFKGEDTCSLINHINSDHGINFGLNVAPRDSCIEQKQALTGRDRLPPAVPSLHDQSPETSQTAEFQCKWGDCTQTFDSAATLTKHLEEHLDRGKSEYQCLWRGCNRKFAQRQKLVRHLKVHSGYKPHKCQVCAKCFSNEDTLTQHMRIHSGEKPFECHICGKRFSVSSSLKIHIRTHTGEKPLQCKVCGKRFSESSNLSKHMKCHKKKYSCENCKRGFDTIEKLQAHEARCFKTT